VLNFFRHPPPARRRGGAVGANHVPPLGGATTYV